MKKNRYRCSACDEVKSDKTNIVYKAWDAKNKPENCAVVGICRKCNAEMNKQGITRVEKYLEYRHEKTLNF